MKELASAVPVLDIGGTHVTAAVVRDGRVVEHHRSPLDPNSDPGSIVEQIVRGARRLSTPPATSRWGVAVPGPFDYANGVGDFSGVDKFQRLRGFDLGGALRHALPGRPAAVSFLNDAEAYALGEWQHFGRPGRMICLTLGTGVGSGFLVDGVAVTEGPSVPNEGNIHTELWQDLPLEQTVSRSGIRRAFLQRVGSDFDVDVIAQLARDGDRDAGAVLTEAMIALGAVLARWVDRFAPDLVVIGGSISRSWDVLEGGLLYSVGFARHDTEVHAARATDEAPLIGAAIHAMTPQRSATAPPPALELEKERPGR